MVDLVHLLNFEEANESFKWHGTPQELKSFVNSALDLSDDQHGELSIDKAHNAVSYKIKNSIYIRLYNTTHKLVVNGPDNHSFKIKLLDLVKEHDEKVLAQDNAELLNHEEPTVSFGGNSNSHSETTELASMDPTSVDEPVNLDNGIVTSLKSEIQQVRKDLEKLQDFVYSGRTMQITLPHTTEDKEEKGTQIKSLQDENRSLRKEIEGFALRLDQEKSSLIAANAKIKELEIERSSLITAVRLLQLDGQTHQPESMNEKESKLTKQTKERADQVYNAVSFVRDENQAAPGDMTVDNVPGDTDSSEQDDSESGPWTKVERKKRPSGRPEMLLIGDSIIKNLDPERMSKRPMVKRVYKGRKLQDIQIAEENLPPQGFKSVLIHAGTNNLPVTADGPNTLAKHLEELGSSLEKRENCKVIISSIIAREDADYDAKLIAANAEIRTVCRNNKWVYVDNENIDSSCLNTSGLHLNTKGDSMLASNLIRSLRKQSNRSSPHGNDKRENFRGRKNQSAMWELLNLLGKLR